MEFGVGIYEDKQKKKATNRNYQSEKFELYRFWSFCWNPF